ncbi:sterol carrier family protein [Streptomyces pathocidini]|uniref:Sterol carrier family protein n=1 Tax=Streptomyces pathocidini TaxID=1650571 RepID=A0ABW7URT4_9ACTN|nr:sterol carrier family protein [Streptomyces pathocidini]
MPRKPRARTYDPAKVRGALTAQVGAVREAVAALCADAEAPRLLAAPTRLGSWSVRELIVHIALALDALPRVLAVRPAPAEPELDLLGYVRPVPGDLAEATAARVAAELETLPAPSEEGGPRALLARLDGAAERLAQAVAEAGGATPVPLPIGALTVDDFLVTRLLELVVHADDLADATGRAVRLDRQALAAATRLLADALAAKAPGGSVEVRIPPYAVVQCVQGPRHTRGTPPNVVETDSLTWIRLATGRTTWPAALDSAALTASGERADLSDQLPLLT